MNWGPEPFLHQNQGFLEVGRLPVDKRDTRLLRFVADVCYKFVQASKLLKIKYLWDLYKNGHFALEPRNSVILAVL